MNKKGLYGILSLLCTGVTALSVALSVAWFDNRDAFSNTNLQASSVSNYFASGDGTAEHPYEINQPIHIYNLTWLQSRGMFDAVKTYFELSADIDMAGQLGGETGRTGAIPPIGTDLHHFVGSFDGNGHAIKNIWVSSNPDDWKEKPYDVGDANTNTHVGFFGNIDQNDEFKGIVRNFYLENIEVTSHVDSSFVGIIAGYSNSYTENIGVKNGRLSFKQGTNNNHYMSEASLIGKIGDEAYWEDMPSDSGQGGNLKIDPSDTTWQNGGTFSSVTSGTYAVPGSLSGTAYVSSTMNSGGQQALNTVYKYNTKLSFATNSGQTIAASSSNSSNASSNRTLCSSEFWARYDAVKDGTAQTIQETNRAPAYNNLNTFTVDGVTKSIPQNCIWFKPQAAGTCGISFTVGNMNSSRYTSLYRFKRVSNTQLSSAWNEITLKFAKGQSIIQNKVVVYYEIDITQDEVDEGYEYCIGWSKTIDESKYDVAKFFFLYLAGTDESSGPSAGMAGLKCLDYVYKLNGQYLPAFDESFTPNHLKLIFDFNAMSDDTYALFNMEDITNSQYVYYYNQGMSLVDMITNNSVGRLETTTTRFPDRIQT